MKARVRTHYLAMVMVKGPILIQHWQKFLKKWILIMQMIMQRI